MQLNNSIQLVLFFKSWTFSYEAEILVHFPFSDKGLHVVAQTSQTSSLLSGQTHLILFKHYMIVQFMKLLKVQAVFLCSHFL